jgi:hypothetical protein
VCFTGGCKYVHDNETKYGEYTQLTNHVLFSISLDFELTNHVLFSVSRDFELTNHVLFSVSHDFELTNHVLLKINCHE